MSILTVTASIPQNITLYRDIANKTFSKFKMSAMAITENRGLKTTVTKGEIDPELAQQSLAELAPGQRKKLSDFIRALSKVLSEILIFNDFF